MGYILLAAVAAFFAVVLIRTLRFTPKPQPPVSEETVEFDREKAVSALAELVKCRTVSYNDPALEDDGEFQKLIALLPEL